MKSTWAMVVCLAVVLSLGSSAGADPVPVYRGLVWGDSPSALGSFFDVTSSMDVDYGVTVYRRSDEPASMGVVDVARVNYFFFNDQLYKIQVWASSENISEQYDMASRMLESRYGGYEQRFLSNTKTWTFRDTRLQLIWHITRGVYMEFISLSLEAAYDVWLDEYKDQLAAEKAMDW